MRLVALATFLSFAGAPVLAQSDNRSDTQSDAQEQAEAPQGQAAGQAPRGTPEGEQPPQAGPPRFLYELSQTFEVAAVPHVDGGGDAVTTLSRSAFSLVWVASRQTQAIFNLSNEFAYYDFDDAFKVDPIDGEPFGSFSRQNLDVVVNHRIARQWSIQGLAGVGLTRERSADLGDSVVWRTGVGSTYHATENISLGVFILANSRLEDDVEILPLPQIEATFEFDEHWTLILGSREGATLRYRANDELAFRLQAGYQERQYRLDDDGFAPDGVFQDKSIDLMLGVQWTPAPGLEVTAGVGSQLWRRFKIKDGDGNRLTRSETDPTLTLQAGLSYSF
ncbi:hypothetical protein AY599_18170 [Leptolyngbya valderiana BDU 20041]|nr:hypothetical protein AY599_18170 [Leptolyngbya valderiana BDU 20041]